MARSPAQALQHFLATDLDALLRPGEGGDGFPEALALLRRASESVPAYAAMLQKAGIGPGDILEAGDFARLPLLTKENYVRRFPLEALVEGGDLAAC
ncbi:MAG TPA: phenylacetate--CoA ligase family protein, partial [Alphaproteobacteria bacterium]|nr:phenylacetate--CoA ligase family protein [Alphaproteobacteria bacterium]